MFQALGGLYEISHVHLPQWVSIATEGLTLGSTVRRKMFQLKMYMAISGRAPERGLPAHRRQLPAPTPAPPVQSVLFMLCLLSLNEKSPRPHPLLPSHATSEGWNTDQWDSMVQSSSSGTRGPWPLPTTLFPYLPAPFPVWVKVDVEGQGASFASQPLFVSIPVTSCISWATGLLEPNVRPSS